MTDTTTAIPQPLPQVVQPTAPKGQRVELGAGWVTPKGDISIALNAVNLSGFTQYHLGSGENSPYATLFTNTKKVAGSKQPDYQLVAFINKGVGS